MKAVGVLVLCIVSQVCGLALPGQFSSLGSDKNGDEEVATAQVKARELLIKALDHLSQDLNDTQSKIETKLESLQKVKVYMKQVNPLDLFVNISLNTINSENEVEGVDVSTSRGQKKYSVTFADEKVNWYSAKRLCKDKGLELASVESEEEQKQLEAAIRSSGLSCDGAVWIGGRRDWSDDYYVGDEFVWSSSGRPLSYTNWVPEDSSYSPLDCVEFSDGSWLGSYGQWIHNDCDNARNCYACKYIQ